MNEKIDFVLIWVDGNDIEWQKQRNIYAGKSEEDLAEYRFRDWDNLKYWFRGVEKFAPWVNNIYFVTCGHYPKWLNLNHPKLKFVKHEDYIPKEYLPTFSANPIETNLHRLKGLEEQFVFFNDDMFLINFVTEKDFFENKKPKYVAGLSPIITVNNIYNHLLLNDIFIINQNFNKNDVIKKNFSKWFKIKYGMKTLFKTLLLLPFDNFTAFQTTHMPTPLLKSTMKELWENEKEVLERTSQNRFRSVEDVNQYLFSWYDIARGNFESANIKNGKYYDMSGNNEKVVNDIKRQKSKMICLNDSSMRFDFEKTKKEIIDAFETILPEKSSFEI